jgi:hypothetical protein
MNSLAELVIALVEAVPADAGGPDAGVRVDVERLAVALPIEARLAGGELRASAPRGRLGTGFDPPVGRIELAITRGAA